MAEALMTEVTEREAASMYARACRAWYGRRAPRVIKEKINAERNEDKDHHPSENAERPVRTVTFFGNIKIFDHDVIFHRLPYQIA
jgi:hypothetical protein